MPSSLVNRHRIRRSFGSLSAPINVPQLLKVQLDSFERFLQREVPPDQREDKGLETVFRSVFPVSDFSGSSTLEFVHYPSSNIMNTASNFSYVSRKIFTQCSGVRDKA